MTSATAGAPATRGRVYIASVTDDRKFENKPSDPSTPSIDGDVTTMSAAHKDQMIGRQRDSFGIATGDIKLPPGDSVTGKVRRLVEDGLARAGYQASADSNAPNSIAVSINQFWARLTSAMSPPWSPLFHKKVLSRDRHRTWAAAAD